MIPILYHFRFVATFTIILALGTFAMNVRIPPEWEGHQRTIMVWPQSPEIWNSQQFLDQVRAEIAQIAKTISKYEPVTIIAHPSQAESARVAFSLEELANISFLQIPVNDLWARDTLPLFGIDQDSHSLVGIDLNFNGWGMKQEHEEDGKLAKTVLEKMNITRISSNLVGESGSFEFDGEGTLLVTQSSIFNKNRNPSYETREELEKALKSLFNVEKVIWFDGAYNGDINDAHVDSLVRFASPGVVLLNRPFPGSAANVCSNSSDQAKSVLQNETDAKGRRFTIVELFEPDPDKVVYPEGANQSEFLASYVNFLLVNGAVIIPSFGDETADQEAEKVVQKQFPQRAVVPVRISWLGSGGGGIHRATHDLPKVNGGSGVGGNGTFGLLLFIYFFLANVTMN